MMIVFGKSMNMTTIIRHKIESVIPLFIFGKIVFSKSTIL